MAFSGGGDSLALLIGAKAWADRRGRPLAAVTVDHRLRPAGADWAAWCRHRAEALGVPHETLAWHGDKPSTGLAAAARVARHALLAEAARRRNAVVILLAHTADDRDEAALMRAQGAATPSPREWAPSPVWPEGRGVFLLRPLLAVRRDALRVALAALGEHWIEDPANVDPSSHRARARSTLARSAPPAEAEEASGMEAPRMGSPGATAVFRLADVREGPAADLELPAVDLLAASDAAATLGAALLSAAGGVRPPRRQALDRLLARAAAARPFVATLARARLVSGPGWIRIARDAADRRRGGFDDIALPPGESRVWDGRFEVTATEPGAKIGFLSGRAAKLPESLRRAILSVPAAGRPALPLVTWADGDVECPTLVRSRRIQATSLALPRLLAARGGILDEATLRRMAKVAGPS